MAGAPLAIAAVLLAAGSSRRFGTANKLLADAGGMPLVRCVALALRASRVAEIVAVTGPDAEAVKRALEGLGIRFVHNARHAEGMGGSVATGVAAVGDRVEGALIVQGDMPSLDPALIDRLIAAFENADGHSIVHPALEDGSQRNPVLWPRAHFSELAALSGEQGAKPLLAKHRSACLAVTVAGAGTFADIDTAEDLERFRATRDP